MDFIDFQTTFIVGFILTVVAVAVFFDIRRKQSHRVYIRNTAPHQSSSALLDPAPIFYAPVKRPAAERALELVPTVTSSRPPVQPRMERETVTVQLAQPSPSAPSPATEVQLVLPPFTIDEVLWERLIAGIPKQNLLPPLLPSADDGPNVAESTELRGMIQQPALEELLDNKKPFSGLVISIGVNDSDSSMWHSQGLMQSVGSYIAGLLDENDFSCRASYDEFVMVCPGDEGAPLQRRLNRIAERLWDYQLRGLDTSSILFSWSSVEIQNQPLAEAIASATERMRETRRSAQSPQSTLAHRQAV
jgi:hypothetical protein